MISEGQTAFIKTTGEEVFVLGVGSNPKSLPDGSTLSGNVATVRRPVAGENGCYHLMEMFMVEELENSEERMQRHLANQRQFTQRLEQAASESGIDVQTKSDDSLPN